MQKCEPNQRLNIQHLLGLLTSIFFPIMTLTKLLLSFFFYIK